MKKNKLLVILSLALTLSCLLSALSMNVFADMLENYYYVTNEEYTKLTNIYCYSSVAFTGNYDDNDDSQNNAILASEMRGGNLSEFKSTLSMRIDGQPFIYMYSDVEGRQTLSATQTSESMYGSYKAFSEQVCEHITNSNSDYWGRQYIADWVGFPEGWENYRENVLP